MECESHRVGQPHYVPVKRGWAGVPAVGTRYLCLPAAMPPSAPAPGHLRPASLPAHTPGRPPTSGGGLRLRLRLAPLPCPTQGAGAYHTPQRADLLTLAHHLTMQALALKTLDLPG